MISSFNLNDVMLRKEAIEFLKMVTDTSLSSQEVINTTTQTLKEIRNHAYETGYSHHSLGRHDFKY